MATTVMYQPGMQLGKTFDLKTYTTGMSIFTEEVVSKTTKTERHVNNIKYSVVKGSGDVNSILGVSGDMSLKCKTGIVEVEGMGSYLREDRSQENTMEIIARAQVETVIESMKDESPKAGWTKTMTGTHFIRSIIYGGDLIVRIRIKAKSSKEFSDIQAKVKSDLHTSGVVDVGAQAKFKKMEDEIRNTSEIDIEYYSTTAKGEMPRDISGMLKALDTFKKEVQQLNEGKGVPCKCEIVPLNMLDDSYPSILKDSAFSAQMSTLEDKFDDVMIAKSKLDRFLNEDPSDMDLNQEEEDTASSLEQRIDDARQSIFQAISEIDVTSQKEAIPKINDAIKTYKEQTKYKPGGFRREVTQFLKKVSGSQTTPVEEIPKGEDLNLCLLGKTGHGKSSTANNMFGEVWSPSSSDATSGTKTCQKRMKDFTTRKICMIDTPGSMDTRDPKVALEEICTAVALQTDGYDAFLMTVRWNTKMTTEEVMAIELMKKMFGKDILMKYVIFVFTYGDTFEAEQKLKSKPRSFEEYIGSQTGMLSKYLQECNQRYVLINNLHADPGASRQQIIKLVNIVDKLAQENKQQKYSNKYFNDAKAAWEKIGWDSVRLHMEDTVEDQNESAGEVGKSVAKEVTADGNSCFPANGKVMLENGVSIPIGDGPDVNIVLLGKTGHGKSSTGNTILGESRFDAHSSGDIVTRNCQTSSRIYDNRTITVMDTPDTDMNKTFALRQEINSFCEKFPPSALLLVLRWNTRMTGEQEAIMKIIEEISFRKDMLSRTLIVFTHGDTFRPDVKSRTERKGLFDIHVRAQIGLLEKLLKKVDYRYILANNMEQSPRKRLREAAAIVSEIDALQANAHIMYVEDRTIDGSEFTTVSSGPPARGQTNARMYNLAEMHAGGWEFGLPGCFPANASVTLDSHVSVPMNAVRVGQTVLTMSPSGTPTFSQIYLFGHSSKHVVTEFVNVSTRDSVIKLSPDHHIFIKRDGMMQTIPARGIKEGMAIMRMSANSGAIFKEDTVTDVSYSTESGLYAPFTMSGNIIVDGVLASCYVDCVPPRFAHPLLWPVRQVYRIAPSFLAWTCKSRTDGIPTWIRMMMKTFLNLRSVRL